MDEDEEEGYDWQKIGSIVTISLIICGVISLALIVKNYIDLAPYKKVCAQNPRLRYAQSCGNLYDCIRVCAKHQQEEAKT